MRCVFSPGEVYYKRLSASRREFALSTWITEKRTNSRALTQRRQTQTEWSALVSCMNKCAGSAVRLNVGAGLAALPGADGATPDCFRRARCESERRLAEVFYCVTPSLPGACRDRVRSYPSGARLVVHMPAAVAPAEVEYSSGLFNADSLGLAVRAERRERRLRAMRTMELFHASSL